MSRFMSVHVWWWIFWLIGILIAKSISKTYGEFIQIHLFIIQFWDNCLIGLFIGLTAHDKAQCSWVFNTLWAMYMFQFFMLIGFILHELRSPQPLGELDVIGIMVIAIGSVAVTGIAAIVGAFILNKTAVENYVPTACQIVAEQKSAATLWQFSLRYIFLIITVLALMSAGIALILKLPEGDQQEIWSWTSYITHFLGAISILLGILSPVICPRKQIMGWLLIGISFVIAAYLVDYEGYRKWQHQLIYSPIYITLICLVFRKIGIRIISIDERK